MAVLLSGSAKTGRNSILIFVLGLLVFTIGLNPEFIGPQCRYGLFAQEMLHYGPTYFPTTYHNPYPDYPASSTYLIYLLSLPLKKITMLSGVLPTAVTSALILVLIYQIGAAQSEKWGIYAAIFALFTHEFLVQSRSISLDQYTSLATVLCFYLAYSAALYGQRIRLWLIPLLFVAGFLFRGPIGLVIPAAVTCGFYLWEKQYRKCLLFSLAAVLMFGLCTVLLLAAAYQQGGSDLVGRVAGAEATGRLNYYAKNYAYYFIRGFTAYAVSFPLAVITLIVLRRNIFKRDSLNDRLPGHLAFWTAIVIVGMSIPGTKKTHYILPVVPPLSLLASYLFVRSEADAFVIKVRKAFLGICQILPVVIIVATVVSFTPNKHFTAVPVFSGLVTLALLVGLVAVTRTRKFREHSQDGLIFVPVAALSFIIFNTGIVERMVYLHERTKPFVEKVEALHASQPGKIAFYRIGPDKEDLKFSTNLSRPIETEFLTCLKPLLNSASIYYIIAEPRVFSELPADERAFAQLLARGKLGHREVVLFTLSKTSQDRPEVQSRHTGQSDNTDGRTPRAAHSVSNSVLARYKA